MSSLKTKIDSDEIELFREFAKVYRFAAPEWKERGDGELVIAKSDKFTRVLLHREGTGKLACNFPIYELKVEQMGTSAKAVTIACMDYSESGDKAVPTVFAFRFKEEDLAKKFIKLVGEQEKNSDKNVKQSNKEQSDDIKKEENKDSDIVEEIKKKE
ncbi:RAN binding protein 1 [Spironucleus salmonicida]|uniref:RAN binding protein 1 n=1 Tax=Spironucleus salmonicida TaxID=348837 RepID=V6LRM5_9EUKA|nr:RAN binding protein 1 [Spironucleus salmonicida]|eukprot:EST47215.1 RAN binding protein 1 [Spironucleus salmonicida]